MITTKKTNKILIVSDTNNEGVKQIIQWLYNLNVDFVFFDCQINVFQISDYHLEENYYSFKIDDLEYNSNSFTHFYFHKGRLKLKGYLGIMKNREDIYDPVNSVEYYLSAYEISFQELTEYLLHDQFTIGKDNGGRINKIEMLKQAKIAGFNIPNTLITTDKNKLIDFCRYNEKIITKSLDVNFFHFDIDLNTLTHGLTTELNLDQINLLPESFPLSVFQENVEKILELRVFFIGEKIFSAAIFSQMASNTKQDYRNYDSYNSNRVVPFDLPEEISIKIKHFSKITNLKTGSIDLILSTKGEYVFLEINPQGQFIGVSNYCNFYLDKEVAEFFKSA